MRVAALDCGTNAVRLLVADVDADAGRLVDVVREMRIVRLGEGVDRTGEFAPAALERLFAALDEFAPMISATHPSRIRFVATSASRDVSDRAAFITGVRARIGVAPEVITGAEEAELSCLGSLAGLPGLPQPPLVVDIGGGSTEFVLATPDHRPQVSVSVDIGCVRMAERHLHADPATPEQISAMTADIDAAVAHAASVVPLAQAACVVGLSGTVTTVAALAHDLPEYDAAAIHGLVVTTAEVDAVTARLLAMTAAERAALPVMHPGRVEVIGAGATVLSRLLHAAGADAVIASEADLLDGIAFRLARD